MMQRVGSVKSVVIIIVGAGAALFAILGATWLAVSHIREEGDRVQREAREKNENQWREAVRKSRESQAEQAATLIPLLKKGGAFVAGTVCFGGNFNSESAPGTPKGDETTCSLTWHVSDDEMTRIGEGMTLGQVRAVLDLTALHYVPNGPQSRFVLSCKQPDRMAIFVFAGDPDVKLVSKTMK
ncbi:hypothetical protein [Zavarzinella formosa]|uniref:hypothetical protein n=1 Tax=Zavarzinella formosa TaxID=360055 RepID=UPI0012F8E4B3|nr:hypothetical protein [Zavarzinella formosa]